MKSSVEENSSLLLLESLDHFSCLALPASPCADAVAADLPPEAAVLVELEDVRMTLQLGLRQIRRQLVYPNNVWRCRGKLWMVVQKHADVCQRDRAVFPGCFAPEERAGDVAFASLFECASNSAVVAFISLHVAGTLKLVEEKWTFIVQQNFLAEFDLHLVVHLNHVLQQEAHVVAFDQEMAQLQPL